MNVIDFQIKGIVHSKIISLSFTHPRVVPNPNGSLSSVEHKRSCQTE